MHTSLVVFFRLFFSWFLSGHGQEGRCPKGGRPKGFRPENSAAQDGPENSSPRRSGPRRGGCMPMDPLANPGHIPCQLCGSIGGTLTRRTLRMKLRRIHYLDLTVWRFSGLALWRFSGLVVQWFRGPVVPAVRLKKRTTCDHTGKLSISGWYGTAATQTLASALRLPWRVPKCTACGSPPK